MLYTVYDFNNNNNNNNIIITIMLELIRQNTYTSLKCFQRIRDSAMMCHITICFTYLFPITARSVWFRVTTVKPLFNEPLVLTSLATPPLCMRRANSHLTASLCNRELHGDGYLSPSIPIPHLHSSPSPIIPLKLGVFSVQIFTNLQSLHFEKIINVYYSTVLPNLRTKASEQRNTPAIS